MNKPKIRVVRSEFQNTSMMVRFPLDGILDVSFYWNKHECLKDELTRQTTFLKQIKNTDNQRIHQYLQKVFHLQFGDDATD